jgi:hypothetical protein
MMKGSIEYQTLGAQVGRQDEGTIEYQTLGAQDG